MGTVGHAQAPKGRVQPHFDDAVRAPDQARGQTLLPGDVVRLAYQAAGMPQGSEGVVLRPPTDGRTMLVSFWDGGPLSVPADSVELVQRPDPWQEETRD